MKRLPIPFNIDLLIIDERMISNMRPVTVLDTFLGATKNYNPSGLFSNEIFGIPGTVARNARFSYIDLKVSIIHPTVFKALVKMKAFYRDIMSSREFARFDPNIGDFVKSDVAEGRTGYQFFCEYLPKINLVSNDSISRQQTVAMFNKYRNNTMLSKVEVLPAGMRDLEIDDNGRATSDEVNSLYFKLIAISNTINASSVKASLESYNPQRMALQNTFNEIYDYFSKIVEGKKNLMMGKWAGRKVFNTTRNVITSMNTTSRLLGHKRNVDANSTLVGLYQTSKALLPKTLYQLKTGFLSTCFSLPGAPALLTDPVTLESKRVILQSETYNHWLGEEGLEKNLTYFKEDSIRHEPIMVEGHYLGLCYRGPDGTFALINGIEQLPEGRSAEHCTPITLAELIYVAIYSVANNYYGYVTRYPILGIGSIYPSKVYLKSTVRSDERVQLDPNTWEPMGDEFVAYEFPRLDSSFYNSLSPHPSQLKGLTADFDGDVCSFNIVCLDESIKECEDFFASKQAYVGANGRFLKDTGVDTVIYVLRNITGRIKYKELAE